MRRIGFLAAVLSASVGCTSTRMLQREGCWVKQTEKWPGRVSEELGFCSKPAPTWAEDRVARRGEGGMAQPCRSQASAALGQEAENSALKSRLLELSQDRDSLRTVSEGDREYLKQN